MASDSAQTLSFFQKAAQPYEGRRWEIFVGSAVMILTASLLYSLCIPLELTISTLMGYAWVWAITAHVLLIGFYSIRHRLKYTNLDALFIVFQFLPLLVLGFGLVMLAWSMR